MTSVEINDTADSDRQEDQSPRAGLTRRQKHVLALAICCTALLVAVAWSQFGGSSDSETSQAKLPANMFEVGLQLHQNGQYDQALMAYRTVLETDPKSAPVHYNIGQILQVRGELTSAIAEYDAALASDPNLVPALYNRSLALRDLGNNAGAVSGLEAALSREPNHVGALYNLGNILIAQGRPDEGAKLINRAIELDPSLLHK